MINYLSSVADKRSDAYKLKNAKNNNQDASKHPHIQHGDIGDSRRETIINMWSNRPSSSYSGTFCLTELNIAVTVSKAVIPMDTLNTACHMEITNKRLPSRY